ncbi:hypothetical protein [Rhizobium sp. K102]|uniref:hypothetical protein n=1 Tax=Rhizobium sp. K102 TaxID=2918527 RepID=UPI001EFAA3CB|nr:hypothetical protein [Rhizobium sp. K102]ULR42613.1 hypothetical protein MHI61_05470 [Rhizobium sp. K102]
MPILKLWHHGKTKEAPRELCTRLRTRKIDDAARRFSEERSLALVTIEPGNDDCENNYIRTHKPDRFLLPRNI